jgi:DNA-binding NtrC family response regulator
MRAANLSYEDAVRALQESYIVEVLITHAYHLGRTAEELGIHRNTLARTIRELNIDIRKIRNTIR